MCIIIIINSINIISSNIILNNSIIINNNNKLHTNLANIQKIRKHNQQLNLIKYTKITSNTHLITYEFWCINCPMLAPFGSPTRVIFETMKYSLSGSVSMMQSWYKSVQTPPDYIPRYPLQ
jgi:hypothetical protein